ncbi:uncharacterized protein I303_102496 [Kwoniella dejecticola CBS 10117]|uniref:Uncharacterized protein n=1 Tax=Kwoniella dejecticola CBS 10117 TaxID=1296121 RepID=A0A1A6A8X6_9TREE|nr:uncharacterized protein I303_02510 [Kwoniella dejecticola CBS 10117]OBR86502.1 hypothetical protein I303_02510 [Kwoniella dejecticola CBS 10117]
MIDSLNQPVYTNDNSTLVSSSSSSSSSSQDAGPSLIEIILADTPFLALGFLGLTLITFYSTFNRSSNCIILLQTSALTACFASLFNLVGMFYHSDQVAAFTFQSIQEAGLKSFILTMLTVKQILLATSSGTRLLYFHFSLEDNRKARADTNTKISVSNSSLDLPHNPRNADGHGYDHDHDHDNEKRPRSFTTNLIENHQIPCDQFENTDSGKMVGRLTRWAILVVVFCVFALELTWRIGFLFDFMQAKADVKLFRHVNLTDFSLQLILYLLFSSCPIYHITQTSPPFRMKVARQYGGLLGGIVLGLVVVLGSLASLGFSDTVVGRLFQAVQIYVLITSQMIMDFSDAASTFDIPSRRLSTTSPDRRDHAQNQFEGLSTPTASTFRVSPPSISTPSPPPLVPSKRVSFHPATATMARRYSTGLALTRRDKSNSISRQSRASVSSRIKTWVLSAHTHSQYLGADDVEQRLDLTSRETHQQSQHIYQRSSTTESAMSTYETHQNTFGGRFTPSPSPSPNPSLPSKDDRYKLKSSPASPEPARRSSQTIFNNLSRYSRYSQNSFNHLVGIRRTISSPGARLLVLGQEAGTQTQAMPNQSRGTGLSRESRGSEMMHSTGTSRQSSGILDIPPNFPRPPERVVGSPSGGRLEVDVDNEDMPLSLPIRPFAQQNHTTDGEMGNKGYGHGRMRSDLTHINVTSFIEGDSKHGSTSTTTATATAIQPATWLKETSRDRRTYQSDLSEIPSALSSEAPTEMYLPNPRPGFMQQQGAHSPMGTESHNGSGSEELTPTYSTIDVHEARITKAITARAQSHTRSQPSSSSLQRSLDLDLAVNENEGTNSIQPQSRLQSKMQRGTKTKTDTGTRKSRSSSDYPMPESPTLPSSASSFARPYITVMPQAKIMRANTTGSEKYRSRYGMANMI